MTRPVTPVTVSMVTENADSSSSVDGLANSSISSSKWLFKLRFGSFDPRLIENFTALD